MHTEQSAKAEQKLPSGYLSYQATKKKTPTAHQLSLTIESKNTLLIQ
jgi:hypothetical protein